MVLPSSDPTAHLLPNKPKDFTAFINLVDFCRYQYQSPSTSLVPDLCVLSGITTTIESGYTAQICDLVFYLVNGRNLQCSLNHPVLSSQVFVCQFGTWVRTSSYIMRPLSVCPCSELLLKKRLDYFGQWVYPLSHELILQSIRAPLVSGFYKLLSVSMEVAKRIKYFQVNRVHQFHPITILWKDVWYNLRCMHLQLQRRGFDSLLGHMHYLFSHCTG